MEQSKIDRINVLARKSESLTAEEREEQKLLRAEYVAAFKASLVHTLDNTYVVDENGNKRKLREK